MKRASQIINDIQNNKADSLFLDIYQDESMIEFQKKRYVDAIEQYINLYKDEEVEIFSVPGRSEVCGNHTDHQHGMVLATSINLDAIAIVNKNEDMTVRVVSEGYDMIVIDANDVEKVDKEEGTSIGLIRGVLAGLKERGYKIGGFNAYVTSDVLIGAGLSSSAAFETIIGTIVSGLYNDMQISMVEIAQIGQYSENVYFGKPSGLMDQTACAVGGLIHIDFKDPKAPVVEKVDVDFENHACSLCIVDTKGSHQDLTPDYAQIPADMKAIATYFGKEVLRDVDEKEFFAAIPALREKLGDRPVLRAMHFFGDNARVAAQVASLREGRFEDFLNMIKASGDSSFKYLQNVYSVKNLSRQEMAVGLALSDVILKGKGVSRVHGGGFAGTIQAFVPNDIVDIYKKNMEDIFGEDACHVLKIRKYGGMKVL